MDFPIANLMDRAACLQWIETHFYPDGLKCPHCQANFAQARWFRKTKRSDLDVYRCQSCQGIYNLYSGTVFEGRSLQPEQVILFIRGVCQGQPTAQLARELRLSRTTATQVRHHLQSNAEQAQPQTPLDDLEVETAEICQNGGQKREQQTDSASSSHRPVKAQPDRGSDAAGHHLSICSVVGRSSRQARIRVMRDGNGGRLPAFVAQFTRPEATLYTAEADSYQQLQQVGRRVYHGQHEGDSEGVDKAQTHLNKGGWMGVSRFLRSFRGVHQKYLSGYVAIYELAINQQMVSPQFISAIVRSSQSSA